MSIRPCTTKDQSARHAPRKSNEASLKTEGLSYLAREWSVIAVKDKKAVGRWKEFQSRRPSVEELETMLGVAGVTGIAVICGPVSGGLTCRDFDDPAAYEQWRQVHPDLAATLPTVKTGRGYHVYFRSTVRSIRHLDDGELRGNGCCLLPPSIHPSGSPYAWIVPLPAAELPFVDPVQSGLVPVGTERTEWTECTEKDRVTESNGGVCHSGATQHVTRIRNGTDIRDLEERIEQAIRATLPQRPGERNRRIFDLARHLKGMPELAGADLRDLRPIVGQWHSLALSVITTMPFEDTWGDFQYAWANVRFAKGDDPVQTILQRSEGRPFPVEADLYEAVNTRRLLRFCREFQREAGENPFFLSCRKAGELFGMDHRTAARRLKAMCGDGLLEVVESGGMRANRYRYRGILDEA